METEADLRFTLVVRIFHPDIDPQEISRTLGREPYQAWQAGKPRHTRSGHLMPSVGRESYWIWRRRVAGQRDFFAALVDELDWLAVHAGFLEGLVAAGGQVALGLNLAGDENIGATLRHDVLQRLAALPIDLGIEVFPDMR